MATENKPKPSNPNKNNKKRKNYLPYNKAVKRGAYPLRPGVEGFFITCDGGREHQASNEAIDVIDSFYEELLEGTESKTEQAELSKKLVNKIIKFASSDSSGSDSDDDDEDAYADHTKDNSDVQTKEDKDENAIATVGDGSDEPRLETKDGASNEKQTEEEEAEEKFENNDKQEAEVVEPPVKRQCVETDVQNGGKLPEKVEHKSVDKLIEDELAELGDRSKRRFSKLDTGCNGVVFIQMRKRDGDPTPKDIVQHMITSLASTKKHVSRFLLRVLPVEVSCYTSEEEIKRAIKPIIDKYFPEETETPRKFGVLYDARANTGVDRTKVIGAVAKSVPSLHKVDLANPGYKHSGSSSQDCLLDWSCGKVQGIGQVQLEATQLIKIVTSVFGLMKVFYVWVLFICPSSLWVLSSTYYPFIYVLKKSGTAKCLAVIFWFVAQARLEPSNHHHSQIEFFERGDT